VRGCWSISAETGAGLYQTVSGRKHGNFMTGGKFTACAYHVNNFADFLLAIAGVLRQFGLRAREIKKFRLSAGFWNALCSGVNNFSHAREPNALA
jgi:hypothetical protein